MDICRYCATTLSRVGAVVGMSMNLRMLLGSYHNTLPLKTGLLSSSLVNFEFDPVKVANRAFKKAVRDNAFDFAELALVTFFQAKAAGKPLILMPAVIGEGRFQHHCLVYNADRGHISPHDLAGKRIGIRANSQTTVTWVRGILADDYGVDIDAVHWVTFEDGHVAEYTDPPHIERAPEGKTALAMLLDGQLDLAILGSDLPDDPRLQPVLPKPHDAALIWANKNGVLPINHMVAVNADLARARPDILREVYSLLSKSKQMAAGIQSGTTENTLDMTPFGLESNRRALDMLIRFSYTQGLIPHRFEVDDLFDETTRYLSV